MSARLGLGVGTGSLRAVLVHHGKIVWSCLTPLDGNVDLHEALDHTLSKLPKRFGRRPKLIAAIGPGAAQLKSLGAYNAGNDRVLGDAVNTNVARFFLRNGVPLRVTGVRRESPEGAWIAAMESPVIGAVEEACRRARIRYAGAMPTLAVLSHAMHDPAASHTIQWRDDDVIGEVAIENGRLIRVARFASNGTANEHPLLAQPLRALNGTGWAVADAYGATRVDPRDPLVLRPIADATRTHRNRIALRSFLAMLVAASGFSAAFAPGLLASKSRAYSDETLAALSARKTEVVREQQELARLSTALQRVAEFATNRSRYTTLLAAMTESMPPMTAVINLKADSSGGSLIALSPQGAKVFAAVSQLPGVSGARISGPLTRETIEAAELDRVSVSFGFIGTGPNRRTRVAEARR